MTPEQIAELLLEAKCNLQGEMLEARSTCREAFRRQESIDHNDLRITIDGLLALLAKRTFAKIEKVNSEISYQIGLSASFIRTHYLTLDLLLDGEIIEAVTLLRKNLEVLARLIELDSRPLPELVGKTPNVKQVLVGGTGRIYGHLSEIAHFSTPDAIELLHIAVTADRRGPSLIPVYQERTAEYIDLSHFLAVRFAQWKLRRFLHWYPGADFSIEHDAAHRAIAHAVKIGVLVVPEEPSAKPVSR